MLVNIFKSRPVIILNFKGACSIIEEGWKMLVSVDALTHFLKIWDPKGFGRKQCGTTLLCQGVTLNAGKYLF